MEGLIPIFTSMFKKLSATCILFWILGVVVAQERVLTFGLQVKPIIPSGFLFTGGQTIVQDSFIYKMNPQVGYAAGMVVRYGFDKTFSLEAGLNFVRRNYAVEACRDATLNSFICHGDTFRIIGYEIPVLGLVYVKLSEHIFMNVSVGAAIDLFPSNVETPNGSLPSGEGYYHFSQRNKNRWVQTALLANVGWDLRTNKSGIFYIGASFHRPFTSIYRSLIQYYDGIFKLDETVTELSGNYLTLDLRYFFHEDPEKKKVKTKKQSKTGRE